MRTTTGGFHTRRLQQYPSSLCLRLANCVAATLIRFKNTCAGPGGWRRAARLPPRISNWSMVSQDVPAVAALNEQTLRGRSIVPTPT